MSDRSKFYEIIGAFKSSMIALLSDPALELSDTHRTTCRDKLENTYKKLQAAKFANSQLPVELTYEHLFKPYGKFILRENADFFLKTEWELKDAQYNIFLSELKIIWEALDKSNRRTVWRYIKALFILCDNIMGENLIKQLEAEIAAESAN